MRGADFVMPGLPSPAKVILVSLQRTLFGFHTADICSLYSRYADCADWRLPDLGENHENCFEPGPYGSVWADNCAESFPPALGGLWDASRTPKPTKNKKNPGFRGLGGQAPLFPLFSQCRQARVTFAGGCRHGADDAHTCSGAARVLNKR